VVVEECNIVAQTGLLVGKWSQSAINLAFIHYYGQLLRVYDRLQRPMFKCLKSEQRANKLQTAAL
jgi:hypothetical protein